MRSLPWQENPKEWNPPNPEQGVQQSGKIGPQATFMTLQGLQGTLLRHPKHCHFIQTC
jgi:hypothetical protein